MPRQGAPRTKKSKPSSSQRSKNQSPKAKGSGGGGEGKPSVSPSSATGTAPGLYVVATPIGNARDITLRALDLLGVADVIACEDTRVTAKLLAIHGIRTPLIAYHDHNARTQGPKLIKRLQDGETVALVSDAGTPLVSDPGFDLLRAAVDASIPVIPLPGASSVLTGLVLSALPTDRFFFRGFLPPKQPARRRALGEIASVPATLVFFESPRRLAGTLADMVHVFGPRPAAVLREMTKMFEEARRDTLDQLAAHYAEADTPRGEVVICVGPPDADTDAVADADVLNARLVEALKGMSVRDAAAQIAVETGLSKKDVYARALELSREDES